MPQLNTAAGAIDTANLGVTLMHEHVFIMTTEIDGELPGGLGRRAPRVKPTPSPGSTSSSLAASTPSSTSPSIGLGRYIPRIARIAAATELNIVVATGLYTYNDVPMYFHYLGPGRAARRARDR